MARFGVNVLKRAAFRGGVQHYGNTYYYETPGVAQPALPTLEALLDFVVAREKTEHATTVTFVRGRLWSQIGTPSQNQMLVDKNLTGTGARTDVTNMDRERAFLVRFRAGVDTLGRPVYLRKWWHLQAAIGNNVLSQGQLANTAELDATQRGLVDTFANGFKTVTVGSPAIQFDMVSKGGRPIDGATNAHRFLEHHQLGDEWRQA